MKIIREDGTVYSISSKKAINKVGVFLKPYMKSAVRSGIVLLYRQVDKLERYLIKKIENWEVEK